MIKRSVLCLSILLSSACSQDAFFIKPEPLSEKLVSAEDAWAAESTVADFEQPQYWLKDLNATTLNKLVGEALQNNQILKVANARWQAAKAQSSIVNSARKPQVQADADVSRQRVNKVSRNNYSLDVSAGWEPDVWGRLQDATDAAVANEQAFAADYQAARLSLAADVALSWFAIIESRQQEQLAQQNADTFQQSLAVIEERYQRGLNTALDVRLARTEVATAENQITNRRRLTDGILRQLDVLLGRYPAAELQSILQLPSITKTVPVGLPADLLSRRPDLIAAEQRLNAAGAQLEEAHKNRLPRIRLTTSGGLGSSELSQLLDWDSLVWSLLAGITQPIFEGGRLDAEQALSEAQHKEAWANYAQIVLQAFREVETALAAEDLYTQQLEQLQLASSEALEASELALAHYQRGLTDIITLLQSQRRSFDAQSNLLRIARERLDNRVGLYLALGGEFSPAQAELDPKD